MCGIALGLGGTPKVLGRADNVSEFIMTGLDHGFVEVELYGGKDEANFMVRRDLQRSSRGSSKWQINGKQATEQEVKDLVERDLKITVSNLCTFLPQEKVGEFSGFNSQSLF